MENHVQQHEDHEKHDRQNNFQPLLGPDFELVLAGPGVGVPRWQLEILAQQTRSLFHEAAVVFRV